MVKWLARTIKATIKKIARSAKVSNTDIKAERVEIGHNAVLTDVTIKCKKLVIGDNASLKSCMLFSDGEINLGDGIEIKERAIINAHLFVKIGARSLIDRDVTIGGMQNEKSSFKMGTDGVILYHSYINATNPVEIGNNVGIGGFCMIFTHSSWQNVLKGYPYRFASVKIDDDVWLPWHVFVMPGVAIGKGSTIGGGSVITKDIPPRCLAMGVPAAIVHRLYPRSLNQKEKDKLFREILADFVEYANGFLSEKVTLRAGAGIKLSSNRGTIFYKPKFNGKEKLNEDFLVSFRIAAGIRNKSNWLDLDSELYRNKSQIPLATHLLRFIRRYGIRAKPF